MKTWSDRYTVLGAAMALLLLAPAGAAALASVPRQVEPSRAGAGIALVALAYAGYLALARAFGPVATSAADAAWLVLSPLPRRRVLRRTVMVLGAVSVLAGLVVALGLLSATGVPGKPALRLLAAVVLGTLASAGGMAAAVLAQASSAWDGWLVAAIVVVVVLAVLGAVHGVATPSPAVTTAAASACAVAAAALARRAWTALERIPAHRILEASARTGNVATAAVVMDPGALTWIIEDAHTGPVIWALTGADLALLGCASLLAVLAGRPVALGPLLVVQGLFGTAVAATFLLTARPRPH